MCRLFRRPQNRYSFYPRYECCQLTSIATLNWPTHRGTATAFPMAAFGLSAFFYTLIAGIAFPGNTSGLLMMLSLATSLLVLVSIPFLIVVDHKAGAGYAALPTTERPRRDSNLLTRTKSSSSKYKSSVIPEQETSKSPFLLPLSTPSHLPTTSSTCRRARWSLDRNIIPYIVDPRRYS